MSEWQSIETAPRNKKPVDTYEGYLEKEDRQRVRHAEHCNNMFVAALHRELESMAKGAPR